MHTDSLHTFRDYLAGTRAFIWLFSVSEAILNDMGKYAKMMSSNGNIFRVASPVWGESISHRWIPLKKAGNAELWCFLWCIPEHTAEQTVEKLVIWDAIALIMTSL